MLPLLFVGYPMGSSLGLVTALEWLGQPYRATRVMMPDDMLTDAYAQVNGRQETPVLIRENGAVLTETVAITRWIEDRDGDLRISFPKDSDAARRMHQMTAFLNSSFTASFIPLWAALEMPEAPDAFRETLRAFGRDAVRKRHAQLEALLGDAPFLAGDRRSIADAVFIGVARWADFHEAIDPSDFPRIAALKQRLEEDPAVAFAHRLEDGSDTSGAALSALVPLHEALAIASAR